MSEPDLILLHAPSVYDFRKKPILFGPISDVVPSTQVFEMYPIGFLTILGHLERHGFSVRIINVALRMLKSRRFDAEKLIRSSSPAAFGLDLHWLVHAQGSLELARIVKKHHPDTPVIFGGLSASYYHQELIRYPQVNYVLRGDSTEEPLRQLLSTIREGKKPRDVSGLTWKDGPQVRENPLPEVPTSLDDLTFDYQKVIRSCAKHGDFSGHLPFKAWLRYPIVGALSCRGCVHNCAICGGSESAYRNICGRTAPAYRDPVLMARDIAAASRHVRGPIIVLGDILQAGEPYAWALLSALRQERVPNPIAFEFFRPPSRSFLERTADAVPRFNIQISPESHDDGVRRAFGRHYDRGSLERAITDALELGCGRVDVFFMIGIPQQTLRSARDTVQYCGELLEQCRRAGHAGKVHPYVSPLAPFLDPGSRAFEEPEKHGYRLFYRSLEEHRKALLAPSWKHTLNYETQWMTREELVEATYEAAMGLNQLKLEHGLLRPKEGRAITERIARERGLIGEIDGACEIQDEQARERRLWELLGDFDAIGPSTICKKDEMNWPSRRIRFHPLRVLRGALAGFQKG